MRVFVDTSALYAALVSTDRIHAAAKGKLARLLADDTAVLLTTDYVVLETFSLLQARFGLETALRFDKELCSVLDIRSVSEALRTRGVRRLELRRTRRVSLVDCVSFVFMEDNDISTALAFDKHFELEGFKLL